MKPMKISEIAKAIQGTVNQEGVGDLSVKGVSFDTRESLTGKLFIPLRGQHVDGHSFLTEAINCGAICCLSEIDTGVPAIIVKDAKKALMDLAGYYRSLFDIKVIGITGSNGKTSTKDMVASVLSEKFNVVKTIGNFNNDIGLPTTIFNIDDTTEVAVLEMGMNNRWEIHSLSKVAKPDYAIITNIGVAHIENLGSQEEIFKAKSEILDFLSPKGRFFVNGDDAFLTRYRTHPAAITYGYGRGCNYKIEDEQALGLESSEYNLLKKGGDAMPIYVPVPGSHMVQNSAAAAAVGDVLGLSHEQIAEGIKKFKPSGRRMHIIETDNGMKLIDDSYNSSPDSVLAALEVLMAAAGDTVAILGDMFELGEHSAEMHYKIGEEAAKLCISSIICIGEHSQETYEGAYNQILRGASNSKLYHFEDKQQCMDMLSSIVRSGDTILVKASRGMHFEEIVNFLLTV